MNIKEFSQKISGFEYPARELDSSEIISLARENGFTYIYGMSDDLLELRGMIDDEFSANDGIKIKIGTADINVNAVWCPNDGTTASWRIDVDCPHETFLIMEFGEIFCIGAVIHKDYLNA